MGFKPFKPAPPFTEYRYAYIVFTSKNRYDVRFRKEGDGDSVSKTMQLARYVYSTKLWHKEHKLIPEDMTVDHIDNDRLNDKAYNLQLLSNSDNVKKFAQNTYSTHVMYMCPYCARIFAVNKRGSNTISSKLHKLVYCSEICRWKGSRLYYYKLNYDKELLIQGQRICEFIEYPNGLVCLTKIYNENLARYLPVVNNDYRTNDFLMSLPTILQYSPNQLPPFMR